MTALPQLTYISPHCCTPKTTELLPLAVVYNNSYPTIYTCTSHSSVKKHTNELFTGVSTWFQDFRRTIEIPYSIFNILENSVFSLFYPSFLKTLFIEYGLEKKSCIFRLYRILKLTLGFMRCKATIMLSLRFYINFVILSRNNFAFGISSL